MLELVNNNLVLILVLVAWQIIPLFGLGMMSKAYRIRTVRSYLHKTEREVDAGLGALGTCLVLGPLGVALFVFLVVTGTAVAIYWRVRGRKKKYRAFM